MAGAILLLGAVVAGCGAVSGTAGKTVAAPIKPRVVVPLQIHTATIGGVLAVKVQGRGPKATHDRALAQQITTLNQLLQQLQR